MNRFASMIASFTALLLLSGCWDQAELPERGFVMGLAIDESEEGKYLLSTQIFKPTQTVGGKGNETSYVNVMADDDSVATTIRDIPGHLGRKLQWSHMRIIIIGDHLVKEKKLDEVLDLFYRDNEPRLITGIMITQGRAADYLRIKPLIENTISQQLLVGQQSSAANNAKTLNVNLLKLGLQMKSEVGNAVLPYVSTSKKNHLILMDVEGAALFKKGRMIGTLEADKVESLQIMLDTYKSGIIKVPCDNASDKKSMETVEVLSMRSATKPDFGQRPPTVRFKVNVETALTELTCTKIQTSDDEKTFTDKVGQSIKKQLEETAGYLKKLKFDAIGLGDIVYQKKPALWKQWKEEWDDIFAASAFEFDVHVKLKNSGTIVGNSALKK